MDRVLYPWVERTLPRDDPTTGYLGALPRLLPRPPRALWWRTRQRFSTGRCRRLRPVGGELVAPSRKNIVVPSHNRNRGATRSCSQRCGRRSAGDGCPRGRVYSGFPRAVQRGNRRATRWQRSCTDLRRRPGAAGGGARSRNRGADYSPLGVGPITRPGRRHCRGDTGSAARRVLREPVERRIHVPTTARAPFP